MRGIRCCHHPNLPSCLRSASVRSTGCICLFAVAARLPLPPPCTVHTKLTQGECESNRVYMLRTSEPSTNCPFYPASTNHRASARATGCTCWVERTRKMAGAAPPAAPARRQTLSRTACRVRWCMHGVFCPESHCAVPCCMVRFVALAQGCRPRATRPVGCAWSSAFVAWQLHLHCAALRCALRIATVGTAARCTVRRLR